LFIAIATPPSVTESWGGERAASRLCADISSMLLKVPAVQIRAFCVRGLVPRV